jgi:hypothetical protein
MTKGDPSVFFDLKLIIFFVTTYSQLILATDLRI